MSGKSVHLGCRRILQHKTLFLPLSLLLLSLFFPSFLSFSLFFYIFSLPHFPLWDPKLSHCPGLTNSACISSNNFSRFRHFCFYASTSIFRLSNLSCNFIIFPPCTLFAILRLPLEWHPLLKCQILIWHLGGLHISSLSHFFEAFTVPTWFSSTVSTHVLEF